TSNANDQGTDAVALLGMEKGGPEWLTLKAWESFFCDSSSTENRYVYVLNEAGNHRVFLRTLDGDEVEIPLPNGVVRMARFSSDGERVGLLHASADSPAEIWVYDLRSHTLKQITQSLVAGLERKNFSPPQLAVYSSFDGTSIASFLYLPPN